MIGEHSINGAIVNMSKVNANICECILRIAAENKRESASIKLIMSTKFREKNTEYILKTEFRYGR